MRSRYSLQREVIYDTVMSDTTHPTAEAVYHRLKPIHKNLSLGTVYRNLQQLSDEGKVARFSIDGNVIRYDGDLTPHYHSLCISCGELEDIHTYVNDIDTALADKVSGKILGHNIVFNVLCPKCSIES